MVLERPQSSRESLSTKQLIPAERADAQAAALQQYLREHWSNENADSGPSIVDFDRRNKLHPPLPLKTSEHELQDSASIREHLGHQSISTVNTLAHQNTFSADFSDIKLVVGDNPPKVFRLHRLILMEHCGFFQDVFERHKLGKLYIKGTEVETFENLVKWIYNGSLPLATMNVDLSKLYLGATSFTIPSLQNAIAKHLGSLVKGFPPGKTSIPEKELVAKKDALLCVRAIYLNSTEKQMDAWKMKEICYLLISKITVGHLLEVMDTADKAVEATWLKDVKDWLNACGLIRFRG